MKILLTKPEKQIIKFCKGHYQKEYPYKGRWHESLKPLFTKIYGWNPDEDDNHSDYLNVLFNKLLDIFLKTKESESNLNANLKDVFGVCFYKGISFDEELPIERAIHKLCGLIQGVAIIDNDGESRFDLQNA